MLRRTLTRWRTIATLGVLLAVGLTTTACSRGFATTGSSATTGPPVTTFAPFPVSKFQSSATVRAGHTTRVPLGGGGVAILPAGAAQPGTTVTVSSADPPGHLDATERPISPPVHIALSRGTLRGAATLEFPFRAASVPRGVNPTSAIGVSTYDDSSHTWVELDFAARISGRMIIVRVPHFSWWDPWTWDWANLGARVSQDILQFLGKRAGPPSCSGGLPSYVSSVTVQDAPSVPIRGCAETSSGSLDVKLVDNRNYGVVVHYGEPVSWGWHARSSNLLGAAVEGVIDHFLGRDELYIPPLGSAAIGIPNGGWEEANFTIAPNAGTVVADLALLALSDLPVPATLISTQVAIDCGRLFSFGQFSATAAGVYTLASQAASCLDEVAKAIAKSISPDSGGGKALHQAVGILEAARYAGDVGIGLDLGAELGDLILGTTVDRTLRNFAVFHSPASTTTSSPTTTSTSTTQPSLAVGSSFDSLCVVAWPTAPTITNSSIIMTMSCESVPETDYLFTNVTYDDPNLPITPDTGEIRVIGRVVNVATSDFGYRELVVQASNIILPSHSQGGG
jgi:hypothetical protein